MGEVEADDLLLQEDSSLSKSNSAYWSRRGRGRWDAIIDEIRSVTNDQWSDRFRVDLRMHLWSTSSCASISPLVPAANS